MVNTRIIIYFFIIINTFIKCDVYSSCESSKPNDKYDCIDRISEDDKDDGYHCCFRKDTHISTSTVDKFCEILGKDDFNDIEGYKSDEKIANSDLSNVEVECHQSYIKLNKYTIFALLNLLVLIIN